MILLANVIAILLTLCFKILVLMFVHEFLFAGFFRKSPIGGNVLMIALSTCLVGNKTNLFIQY
jgi:hypothetical protein